MAPLSYDQTMRFLKGLLSVVISIRTSLVLLVCLLFFLLAGAFVMPGNPEFKDINSIPLTQWFPRHSLGASWWLYGAISVLAALAVNTIACSVDSVLRKRQRRRLLLVISPQIIHVGFLFILLAHLLSALGGFKGNVAVQEGSAVEFPDKVLMVVKSLKFDVGPHNHVTNWRADVQYVSATDGTVLEVDYLAPNKPSFFRGLGVYLKDTRVYPVNAALLEINREPGAVWALLGGVLFMVGTIALLAVKISAEK